MNADMFYSTKEGAIFAAYWHARVRFNAANYREMAATRELSIAQNDLNDARVALSNAREAMNTFIDDTAVQS